jgi:hypothetical protein
MSDDQTPLTPLFRRGQWATHPDPVHVHEVNGSISEAGYSLDTSIGDVEESPLAIEVYRRPAGRLAAKHNVDVTAPAFYVQVTLDGSSVYAVQAGDIADLMDLLSRWVAPVQQAAMVNQWLAEK